MDNSQHIAIAWYGLPYYGARVLGEMRQQFPEAKFTIISTEVGVPYSGLDAVVGLPIKWINDTAPVTWADLGAPIPDVCIITSWSHPAYMALAREAKSAKGAIIVSMTDNYFHGTLKQLAGTIYFRFYLRRLFDFMWVPGERARHFMRFLGMPSAHIKTGLYAADSDLFYPPKEDDIRSEIVFVGQFIERKGVAEIVKAMESDAGRTYRSRLRLIGHGPLEDYLKESGVATEPFKQPAELGAVYRKASALLLPSTLDHWGVVAHEAALCGCLILATRQCGCVDDLVVHQVNGYIMKQATASEICKALAWLDSRTVLQIDEGRAVSLCKGAQFSPKLWVDTLSGMLSLEAVCR